MSTPAVALRLAAAGALIAVAAIVAGIVYLYLTA